MTVSRQLEEERNLLQHADDIKQTIQHILQISSMENNGLIDQLSQQGICKN